MRFACIDPDYGMERQITKNIVHVSKPYPFMKSNMENDGDNVQAEEQSY